MNPIPEDSAVFAGLTLLDRFDGDITKLLRIGDVVVVDPQRGEVTIEQQGG